MMRFSANLGFLWKDRPFLDRIAAARAAGFEQKEGLRLEHRGVRLLE